MDSIETLRSLMERATVLPWLVRADADRTTIQYDIDGTRCDLARALFQTDAALIVAAVNSLPTLLDEIEKLRGALVRIVAMAPVSASFGGVKPLRCRVCGYRGHAEGEERHSDDCAYVIARAALSPTNPEEKG